MFNSCFILVRGPRILNIVRALVLQKVHNHYYIKRVHVSNMSGIMGVLTMLLGLPLGPLVSSPIPKKFIKG